MKYIVNPKSLSNIGERVAPINLMGWNYGGLAGIPDQPNVSHRYAKGHVGLELLTFSNIKRSARDVEDKQRRVERAEL
jgi:hypothetical protein